MVANIDLKPLTPELIEQMGYNNHDLWMVKINSTVFGPFETESLKHYVHDNEALFETAEASKSDEKDWKPFWAHTKFQRRKPQGLSGEQHEGPFWLMHAGLKVGPFSYKEIDKKLEMDLLGMTDHISTDNGDTWVKIYEISGFDRRIHSPEELPIAPAEISFQKARLQVVDKIETPHVNTNEALAELAWQGQQLGKVIQFRAEDISMVQERKTEVSHSMNWAMPAAAIALVAIITSGYMMISSEENEVLTASNEANESIYKKKNTAPEAVIPSPSMRSPASVGYSSPDPVVKYESRYPTHVETHEQYQEPIEQPYNDPVEVPASDADQPQEHSLVTNNHGTAEENSLDAAMNGTVPDQPVIEEASDF